MVKYVEFSFEILDEIEAEKILKKLELAGRVCYKSEEKITPESSKKLMTQICASGHLSVIEHVNISVRFICNRGFTHELVRHRLASYSQESTRYCDYGKDKFKKQISVIDQRETFKNYFNNPKLILKPEESRADKIARCINEWILAMEDSERHYMNLREIGLPPQLARGVLVIDLKTEIIMTANLREWKHVFLLRTSESAHPNMRDLMSKLLSEFENKIPIIFDELKEM